MSTTQLHTWKDHYLALMAYKTQYGTIQISPTHCSQDPLCQTLAMWVTYQQINQHKMDDEQRRLWAKLISTTSDDDGQSSHKKKADPPAAKPSNDAYNKTSTTTTTKRKTLAMLPKKRPQAQPIQPKPTPLTTTTTNVLAPLRYGLSNEKWIYMFERLKKYKEENGHCNVPTRYEGDPQLGKWVSRQRECMSTIHAERKIRLDSIGFQWRVGKKNPNLGQQPTYERQWMERLQQLQEFYEKYHHVNIPSTWPDEQFRKWVQKHRGKYQRGEFNKRLDRKALLDPYFGNRKYSSNELAAMKVTVLPRPPSLPKRSSNNNTVASHIAKRSATKAMKIIKTPIKKKKPKSTIAAKDKNVAGKTTTATKKKKKIKKTHSPSRASTYAMSIATETRRAILLQHAAESNSIQQQQQQQQRAAAVKLQQQQQQQQHHHEAASLWSQYHQQHAPLQHEQQRLLQQNAADLQHRQHQQQIPLAAPPEEREQIWLDDDDDEQQQLEQQQYRQHHHQKAKRRHPTVVVSPPLTDDDSVEFLYDVKPPSKKKTKLMVSQQYKPDPPADVEVQDAYSGGGIGQAQAHAHAQLQQTHHHAQQSNATATTTTLAPRTVFTNKGSNRVEMYRYDNYHGANGGHDVRDGNRSTTKNLLTQKSHKDMPAPKHNIRTRRPTSNSNKKAAMTASSNFVNLLPEIMAPDIYAIMKPVHRQLMERRFPLKAQKSTCNFFLATRIAPPTQDIMPKPRLAKNPIPIEKITVPLTKKKSKGGKKKAKMVLLNKNIDRQRYFTNGNSSWRVRQTTVTKTTTSKTKNVNLPATVTPPRDHHELHLQPHLSSADSTSPVPTPSPPSDEREEEQQQPFSPEQQHQGQQLLFSPAKRQHYQHEEVEDLTYLSPDHEHQQQERLRSPRPQQHYHKPTPEADDQHELDPLASFRRQVLRGGSTPQEWHQQEEEMPAAPAESHQEEEKARRPGLHHEHQPPQPRVSSPLPFIITRPVPKDDENYQSYWYGCKEVQSFDDALRTMTAVKLPPDWKNTRAWSYVIVNDPSIPPLPAVPLNTFWWSDVI